MIVVFAFISVVLIWGSTPVAIQWSLDHIAFSFAVMARMVIGVVICLVAMRLTGNSLPIHRRAIQTYLAGGLGLFGAMLCSYWGARFIPSGWISVMFGLSPILTGVLALFWLKERFGWERWTGTFFGVAGLSTIFMHGIASGSRETVWGVVALLCAVSINAVSTVVVKGLGMNISALATATGSLLVAVPCFFLVWLLDGHQWPEVWYPRVVAAILYLGIIASTVGFGLFYFLLKRLETSQTMLITLLSPVVALYLGVTWNREHLDERFLLGASLIMLGLITYQWGRSILRKLRGSWAE